MSDNPRPVLYGSGYETMLPRAADAARPRRVTLVGKHCESGDVLVRDAQVPDDIRVGDILATPVTGARSEEHTSDLQSLIRNSYPVFCLEKKKKPLTSDPKNPTN